MPKKIVYFLALLVIPSLAPSQNHKIDSLQKILVSLKSNELDYVDALYELGRQYIGVDNDASLRYVTKALTLSKEFSDSLRIVKATRLKAQLFRRAGKIDSAFFLFNEALSLAKRNGYKEELKIILNALGVAYLVNGKYDAALSQFYEVLDLQEHDKDQFGISLVLHNIGMTYYKLENYDKAILYYERELKIKESAKINYLYSQTLSNIGLCYANKYNFSQAEIYVNRGFSICSENCSEEFLLQAHYCLGMIAFNQGKFSESEIEFQRSYALSRKNGDTRLQLDNLSYLLQIYLNRGQILLAEKVLKDNESLIESGLGYRDTIVDIYSQLVKLFSKSNNFEKVAFYQGKYISFKNSVYRKELTTNLMKIEAEHLEKENKAKIDSQTKILALNEQVILRQRYLNLVIGVVALLLIALAIVLVKSNRQKQRLNQLLDKRVTERTQELEQNRDVLIRACEERDILISKAAADIRSSLLTIKGLCHLGIKDLGDAHHYFDKLNVTSDNFSEIIKSLIYHKTSARS